MTPAVARAEITQITVIGFRGYLNIRDVFPIEPETGPGFEQPNGFRHFWRSGCCCVRKSAPRAFRKVQA
jgi:hypothetical protein